MFGKSASSITDYLISSDSFDLEYCPSLLYGSLKKKVNTIVESIEGYKMTGTKATYGHDPFSFPLHSTLHCYVG
jgi:hypothetical protein